MTKYFNARVEMIQKRTVWVQVAGNEANAVAAARRQAELKAPDFRATTVELKYVGESELEAGSRVVHRIFGSGVIESVHAESNGLIVTINFDRGDTKSIFETGSNIRPESLVGNEHSPPR